MDHIRQFAGLLRSTAASPPAPLAISALALDALLPSCTSVLFALPLLLLPAQALLVAIPIFLLAHPLLSSLVLLLCSQLLGLALHSAFYRSPALACRFL